MIVKASSGHRFSLGIINIRTAGLFYSGACDKRGAKLGASTGKVRSFPFLFPFPGARLPPRRRHSPMWAKRARLCVWKSILHINIHLSPKFRGRPESSSVHTKPDGEGLLGRPGLPLAASDCRGAGVSLIIFSMFCTRNVSQKGLSAPFAKLFHNNVMLREPGCKLFFGRLLDQLGQRGSGGSRRRRRRRLLPQQWYLPATSVRSVLRAAKLRTFPRFEQTQ